MDSYLHMAIGESIDSVTPEDIRKAILAIKAMDEEHGAFWVVMEADGEIVLETHNDLILIGLFSSKEIRAQLSSWADVEQIYILFLESNFAQVKSIRENHCIK